MHEYVCSNKKAIASQCGKLILTACIITASCLSGCGGTATDVASVEVSSPATSGRTNEIRVLTPQGGATVIGNDVTKIDHSNSSEGYIIVSYTGDNEKIKFQLTGPDQVTYTYNIYPGVEAVLPISAGSGDYDATLYENIGNNQYSTNFSDIISVNLNDEYRPFLYPNQYVEFSADSRAVSLAAELTKDATCELEAVGKVYGYVINNIVYDKMEAETVQSGYLPDVDEVIETGKGICFDYAALMASMLRSQGIPTRLEIGYAKDAYHAWISVYTKDEGWIGGVIQFDGKQWTLMDPTLGANANNSKAIKEFIGDGTTYNTQYMY